MKKTTCFISLAIAALFVSCSNTTDDASISLSVPRELVSSVFKSTDSSDSLSDYAVKKVKCTLLDENEKEIDSQTDDIAENTNTVITFSEIPAGTEVSVSATIYGSDSDKENSPEYRLYTGQSGKITVKPGNNTITLKLEKTKDSAEISIDGIDANENFVLTVSYKATDTTTTVTDGDNIDISSLPLTAKLSSLPASSDEITIKWLLNDAEQSASESSPETLEITANSNIQAGENTLIAEITYGSQLITRTLSFTLSEPEL
ncbi:hypothetical protein [Treponema porcinum]|uniref:hypothetical protein n=1 Tax=Treponema porcinum TaxID=261392 RepID=UPI003F0B6CD8